MPPSDKYSRTEPATPKKRHDAREKGQVARSPDLTAWLGTLAGSFLLPWVFSTSEAHVLGVLNEALHVGSDPTAQGALMVLETGLSSLLVLIVPLAAAIALLSAGLSLMEVGRGFSLKPLRPKFSRVSPKAGFRRLFSAQTTISLLKQIGKLALVAVIATTTLTGLVHALPATVPISIPTTIGTAASSLLRFVRVAALGGFAIGFGDFLYQRKHLLDTLKMTKQEVKDEAKDREGDPAVRGELRKRSYQIARSRMIQAVRTADVVVANPTHVAIALQYDTTRSGAPVVVAKGVDDLARRMKEEATVFNVPIVEDPPLARSLYAICEVGGAIPTLLYFAVARLLAFVYSLPEPLRVIGAKDFTPSHIPEDPGPDFLSVPRARGRRDLELVHP